MSQQDDRPEDAPTEWLSPALYRQLCDAVDAALLAPPDARDALLAARLGSDQRLLAEARALLASHESSPRTSSAGGRSRARQRRDLRRRPDSATMIRRDSATVIVPGLGIAARLPASTPAANGRHPGDAGAVRPRRARLGFGHGEPARAARAECDRRHVATDPDRARPPSLPARPAARPGARRCRSTCRRPAGGAAAPPEPPAAAPSAADAAAARGRPGTPLRPGIPDRRGPRPPPPAAGAAAPAPAPVRSIDIGAPIPVRRQRRIGHRQLIGLVVAGLLLLVAGGTLWMWRQATAAQQDAEARLAKAEKRFAEVRQLGSAWPKSIACSP